MKLYYSPGACSLSPHILLRELGLPFELVRIDGKTHVTEAGANFYDVNPKGQVPTLQLDDGQILTEGAAIVQYLADRKPEAKLAPPAGSMERYRVQEWLSFIGSELHKTYGFLFNAKVAGEARQIYLDRLASRLDHVERALAKGAFLLGAAPTVADFYLFVVLRWSPRIELGLAKWPGITAFMERMLSRPTVKAAMQAEGLS